MGVSLRAADHRTPGVDIVNQKARGLCNYAWTTTYKDREGHIMQATIIRLIIIGTVFAPTLALASKIIGNG